MKMRGLSPIVSVVMLILIAVAASVLIYVWMTGLVASTPATEPTLQERIKIDAVQYESGTGATIYVRNIGEVTVNMSGAYIIDAITDSVVCSNTTEKLGKVQIVPGNVVSIKIDSKCTLSTGKTYIAKVVTKRGTEATYMFIISS